MVVVPKIGQVFLYGQIRQLTSGLVRRYCLMLSLWNQWYFTFGGKILTQQSTNVWRACGHWRYWWGREWNPFLKKIKPRTLGLVFLNQVVLILKLSVCTPCLLFHIWIKPWLCAKSFLSTWLICKLFRTKISRSYANQGTGGHSELSTQTTQKARSLCLALFYIFFWLISQTYSAVQSPVLLTIV